jgi:hypothetical protein
MKCFSHLVKPGPCQSAALGLYPLIRKTIRIFQNNSRNGGKHFISSLLQAGNLIINQLLFLSPVAKAKVKLCYCLGILRCKPDYFYSTFWSFAIKFVIQKPFVRLIIVSGRSISVKLLVDFGLPEH